MNNNLPTTKHAISASAIRALSMPALNPASAQQDGAHAGTSERGRVFFDMLKL